MEIFTMTVRPLLAVLTGLTLSTAGVAAPLTLTPCPIPGSHETARCGRLEVPEDRAHPENSRKIGIHVMLVPALEAPEAADAIVYLAGGPGEAGSDEGLSLMRDRELRAHHRLLLLDTRGTGQSSPLNCPGLQGTQSVQGFLDNFMPASRVRECREQLATHADVRFYTTAPSVDDVDDVRAALGIDQLDLIGGSYGTRAALEYMRRHAAHVRTAVLMGVDPPGTQAPLTFARDAQAALDGLFTRCQADAGCHAAFPHLSEEFATVSARLAQGPVDVSAINPDNGEKFTFHFSKSGFAQTVRYMLYIPLTAALLPLDVHLAASGNFAPFASTAVQFAHQLSDSSDGLYLSVMCPEEVRQIRSQDIVAATSGTFLGDFRIRQQQAACTEWPVVEVPADLADPVKSPVPTLLIDGQLDPVTPVYRAEQALRTLPNGRLLVLRGGGHGLNGMKNVDCIDRLTARFIVAGTNHGFDASCASTVAPPDFVLRQETVAAVQLSPEQLQRFVGTYKGADDVLKIELAGDHLMVDASDRKAALTPVSPDRFRMEGLPPGFYVSFVAASGHPLKLVLEEGPDAKEEYEATP
jgi:pimeloyl-ACP methyl ester carboxylesterase